MNLTALAQRIRATRLERGLTLEEVAAQAGLTRGWLSKVENFRVTPSLPALDAICQAMAVPLAELFEGLDEHPPVVILRKQERPQIRRDSPLSELVYEPLAEARPARNMDPFVITVPPTDTRPPLTHAGEEFVYLLEGAMTLEYGEESHILAPGDTAYFNGETPHRFVCKSTQPARALVVYHGLGATRADL